MFKPQFISQAVRAARPAVRCQISRLPRIEGRRACNAFSTTSALRKDDKDDKTPESDAHIDAWTTAGKAGESGAHEGQYSRTDNRISVEYPEEEDLPRSLPVQGRGGPHLKKTLASFSLEGRTAVVTGGARGLGLVMAQALAESGADVALVDLNSKFNSDILCRIEQC